MPDFDTGHIFLTTFAPIKDSSQSQLEHTSFTQNVRIALAKMPTAMQSPATERAGKNSPFARNKRNHLTRMFVLNDVISNGRIGKNALRASISKENPTTPQPVDRLNTSYLVFCADIDAISKDGAPLPAHLNPEQQKDVRMAYARELWETMEEELREVYRNCVGFDGVKSADDFAVYLERCHVETTMPFHDYYLELPEFNYLPLKALLITVAVPAVLTLLALLLRILGFLDLPGLGWSTFWTFLGGLALTGLVAYLAIRFAVRNGEKPLPPGKYDDLSSVLKALYLQQNFSNFVVDHQASNADQIHANFGAFLKQHRLTDLKGPTQKPGVIVSAAMASKH